MSFALQTLTKDMVRWSQDRTAILLWLGVPMLVGTLVTSLMGGGAMPTGVLLIVDEDQSFVSNLVAGAYSQGQLGKLLTVEKTGREAGLERVANDDASGLLVIPEGFGRALLEATPVTLELRTNPSQTILPGIITEVTEILLDASFYANELFRDEIDMIRTTLDEPPESAVVASIAVAVQSRVESAAPLLFPPAIDIEFTETETDEPAVSLALLFLPGVILMAMMFASSALAEDYWAERDQGTLRRLVSTPDRLAEFVVGKAMAAAVLVTVVTSVVVIAGFAWHGIGWGRLPLSLLWIAVGSVALFAGFSLLQLSIPNRHAATLANSVVVFPLLMAGGSFFPLAALPDWIAAIGRYTPNGFIADRLTREFTSTTAGTFDASGWLVLLFAAAVGLGASAWRLSAGFARA